MIMTWMYLYVLGIVPMVTGSSYDCSVVGQHLSYCTATYTVEPLLVKGIPFFANVSDFPPFCSQVDELLACFHEVFGHCSVMFYDYDAYDATFHGICSNITFAVNAFDGCIDQTNYLIQTCMLQYRTETIQLYKQMAGEFLNPEVQCRLYTHLRECLRWNTTTSCSAEYSSFLTNIFSRRFTPTLCKDIYKVDHIVNKNNTRIVSKDSSRYSNRGQSVELDHIVITAVCILSFVLSRNFIGHTMPLNNYS